MIFQPKNIGFLHFIGIGGIGMSGIAIAMDDIGYVVQGSDLLGSERLSCLGFDVKTGHLRDNIKNKNGDMPAAVVVSSAIPKDNPELVAARENHIPIVKRADMLAELMRFKRSIVIGGTHGKTTTTAMVGHILCESGADPTIINGGILNSCGTNARIGGGGSIVVESDESDGSFTRLPASIALITNIDAEHMEHYGSFDVLLDAFKTFVENVPFYGCGVLCTDNPNVAKLASKITDRRIITYGFDGSPDWKAVVTSCDTNGSNFDVIGKNGMQIKDLRLSMAGVHNVQNALGSIVVAMEEGVEQEDLRVALASFKGVKRRFTPVDEVDGIKIIDDYAHHPIEIRAVLKTAKMALNDVSSACHQRVIAIMQPHRYTRLQDQFDGFCKCFEDADTVIISDVYEASEKPIDGVNSDALARGVKNSGHEDVRRISSPNEIAPLISAIAKDGDIVIFMGAGDNTKWAYNLPDELRALC